MHFVVDILCSRFYANISRRYDIHAKGNSTSVVRETED